MQKGTSTRAPRDDPSHKQKAIYSLTEAAIRLVPLLVAMGAWGRRHLPRLEGAVLLEGPPIWEGRARTFHLGAPARRSERAFRG